MENPTPTDLAAIKTELQEQRVLLQQCLVALMHITDIVERLLNSVGEPDDEDEEN